MFALWYGMLTYREYKDAIWEKLTPQKKTSPSGKETAVVCPLPPKKPDTSKIPIAEPPKPPRTPSPQLRRPASPLTPELPMIPLAHSSPLPLPSSVISAPKPLEPPAKPPRSPSPHPIRAEAFEDIEYEEDEESSDVEEDDENSVIASSLPREGQLGNSVEFIAHEAAQPNSLRLNQTR